MAPASQETTRPFVGREQELRLLTSALAGADAGRARCVLVTGEPGIGKTSVVERLVGQLAQEQVEWGRCDETEGAPAYWPWIQVLRGMVRHRSVEAVRALAGTDGLELARLVPPLGAREPPPVDDDDDREAARFRLFDAVATLVRRAGEKALLTVVLEDLHWADSESLLMLEHVAGELRDTRVLLVGTYREAELSATTAAPKLLAAVARGAERVALGGLAPDEVAGLLTGDGAQPAASLVSAVHRATGGNPFFVAEIAELLRTRGGAAPLEEGFRVPDTVREAIRRRLDPLPEATRRVLQHAAVLGLDGTLEPLAALGETSPTVVLEDLEPALRAGLAQETQRAGDYRLAHALLQSALLDELGVVKRAELHLRAGEALERLYAGDPSGVLGQLAHHFRQAAPLGGGDKAVEYATRAGDRAIASLGFEEAAGHYERALQSGRGATRDPQRRLELLLKFGDAQRSAGDEDGAHATLYEAARLARERGDAVALARAAVRIVAARAETGFVDQRLVELLEAALAGLGAEDSPLRALTLGALARTLYFAPDPARRDALSREAVEVARRVGDRSVLATVLTDRHFALWRAGTEAERLALSEEMAALAALSGHVDTIGEVRAWRILDAIELGRMEEADRLIAEHATAVAATRIPRAVWHATLVRAARALFDGRIAEAEQLAQRALETRVQHPRNNALQFFAVQLFNIRLAQGRLAELGPEVERVAARHGVPPIWRVVLAAIELARGRLDRARSICAALAKDDFAALPRDSNWLPAVATLAELGCELGEPEIAARAHAAIEPHRGVVVVSGFCAVIHGTVDRYLGIAEIGLGRLDDAVRSLEAALFFAERAGATAEAIRAQSALARALCARGVATDVARGEALAASAARRAAALDAPGLANGFRAGAPAAPSPQPAQPAREATAAPRPAATSAMLRREGDFWTLVFGSEVVRLRDTKGVGYLRILLRHPGRELHALELARGPDERAAAGDAGEAIDPEAGHAYRRRLDELRREPGSAPDADDGRRAEIAALERELARATGLGGRSRRTGSDAERARLNVTRAIGAVIKKIAGDCPQAARHLEASVRTGTFCTYEPAGAPPHWDE